VHPNEGKDTPSKSQYLGDPSEKFLKKPITTDNKFGNIMDSGGTCICPSGLKFNVGYDIESEIANDNWANWEGTTQLSGFKIDLIGQLRNNGSYNDSANAVISEMALDFTNGVVVIQFKMVYPQIKPDLISNTWSTGVNDIVNVKLFTDGLNYDDYDVFVCGETRKGNSDKRRFAGLLRHLDEINRKFKLSLI